MTATLTLIAAGRGGDPDEGLGILTIAIVILVVVLILSVVGYVIRRASRRSPQPGQDRKQDHPRGHVGRSH